MCKDINYYLSKGFDQRTAEYFANGRKVLTAVIPNDNFTLILTFNNKEQRLLDMKPVIKEGTVFAFLSDPKQFSKVYLDENACVAWDKDSSIDSNAVWNNKIDLCSDTCYLDSKPIK